MNIVVLIGRLVNDPDLTYSKNGIAICKFTLAIDRPYKSQGGNKEVDFIDVITWRKLAEIVANNLTKGRLVAVEGRLQISSYDDQQGIRRRAAVVVADQVKFLDYADKQHVNTNKENQPLNGANQEDDWGYDDIPF